MSKELIRKRLIKLRKAKFKNQNIIFNKFFKIFKKQNLKNNLNVGGYYPISGEIGCLDILEKLEKKKFRISLPVTMKNNKMDFYEWSFGMPLKLSPLGIPEPKKRKKVYPDILIVPLVGFDKNKFRLGYGGGYYDRYIKKISKYKKILTIGFSFSFQEIKKIPINKFDQKLDFIITTKEIVK